MSVNLNSNELANAASDEELYEFPLSPTQAALWFINQFNPQAPAYNIPVCVRMLGELDREALQQALNYLVERHEILRTFYHNNGEEAVQFVRPEGQCPLIIEDISKLNDKEKESALDEKLRLEASKAFDLKTGPVLRARLLVLSEREYCLLLVVHHITVDHSAIGLLVQQLETAYQSFINQQEPDLAEQELQYADYVVWLKENVSQEELDKKLQVWKDRLQGFSGVLNLPLDKPRPAVTSMRGAQYLFEASPEISSTVKKFSRRQSMSLYLCLLSAFKVLLQRYSQQDDVIVATPFANRGDQEELESVVGCFINTLPLATDFSNISDFISLLAKVKEVMLEAYDNQSVPLEAIVEALNPKRDQSYNPLFQVGFIFQEPPVDINLHGLECSTLPLHSGGAMYDLHVWMWEDGDRLSGLIWYNTDIYGEQSVARIAENFLAGLASLIANPDQDVRQAQLLTATEQHQLGQWNNTTAFWPSKASVVELIAATVEKTPEAIAVKSHGKELSYAGLEQRASQLANYLVSKGVKPGDFVGLSLHRSVDLLVGLLGILKTGAAYVPLDPDYPNDRLLYMLEQSAVAVLVTESALIDSLPEYSCQQVKIDSDWDDIAATADQEIAGPSADSLMYVIFTSGSTGLPKGVQVPHSAVVNFLTTMAERPGLTEKDTLLAVTTLSFDIAVLELFLPLITGATVVIASREEAGDGHQLAELLQQHAATVMQATPSTWRLLISADWQGDENFKVLCGGEAFPRDLAGELLPRAGEVWNMFGPTETTVWSTCYQLKDADSPILIGQPIANTQCYVVNEHMALQPVGVPGELYIGGDGVTAGYLGRADLTAERFVSDPFRPELAGSKLYRTGDLVRWRDNGNLEYLNRIDNQVKLRGYRIELEEIESVLVQHDGVAECAVAIKQNDVLDERLVAYVVLEDADLVLDKLHNLAEQSLPAYMVPAHIVSLGELPLTPNGKLDRKALADIDINANADSTAFTLASTDTERVVATAFAQLLGLDEVDIHKDFFSLGGHSLLAMQVLQRLSTHYELALTVRDFIQSPKVASIASIIDQRLSQGDSAVGVVAPPRPAHLPIAQTQLRLWYFEQFLQDFSVYTVPLFLSVAGEVDSAQLRNSLELISKRHESLRTRFVGHGDELQQLISEQSCYGWHYHDLTELPEATRQQKSTELEHAALTLHYNLEQGPLWHCFLIREIDSNYQLWFSFHHTIFDGRSADIFLHELAVIHTALAHSKEPDLAAVGLQSVDYQLWQEQQYWEGELATEERFWLAELAGDLPVLDLPLDLPRPSEMSYRGASEKVVLDADLVAALQQLAQQHHTSLFVVFLAAYKVLLLRYTGQHDLIVAVPATGRLHREVKDTIGFLVDTMIVRTQLEDTLTFTELVSQVSDHWREIQTNSGMPFSHIAEKLDLPRDLSHTPLFQTMFSYHQYETTSVELGAATGRLVSAPTRVARTDLVLWLEHSPEELKLICEYNTDILMASSVQRMLQSFSQLLTAVVEGGDTTTPLNQLSVIPATDDALLSLANATDVDWPQAATLNDLLAASAQRRGDAIAVKSQGKELSYAELEQRASQLANYLVSKGVKPGDFVGLSLHRSVDLLVGLLGILKTGAAYVPLDPDYPNDRLLYMLEQSAVAVLVTESALIDSLPEYSCQQVKIDSDWDDIAATADQEIAGPSADSLMYVIFTSGSTGLPKGVQVPHSAVVNFLTTMAERPGLTEKDTLLAVTTLSFDIAVLELFLPLITGATVVIASREEAGDGHQLAELLQQHAATVMQATPSTWRLLISADWQGDENFKVLCGGEAFPRDLAGELLPRAGEVWNMFGPTETTVWSTCYQLKDADSPILIGQPIANTQCYVVNEHMALQPVGVPGELYIGGDGVTAGYLGRADLTAERFVSDPFRPELAGSKLYRTGDLVRWRDNGNLEYLNRIDNQVKVRGYRIELEEIEKTLLQLDNIAECAVAVKEYAAMDKRLVGYVKFNSGQHMTNSEVRRYLREHLPDYMVLQHMVELERMPLTPNGKIDRNALPDPFHNLNTREQEVFIAPESAVEKALAEIWAQTIGVEQISADSNFFEIGGHSLLALNVLHQIEQKFGTKLYPGDLLMSSLEQVAAKLDLPAGNEKDKPHDAAVDSTNAGAGIVNRFLDKLRRK